MERVRSLLVATDFSPRADNALKRAGELVREHQARLIVLHVVEQVAGERHPQNLVKLALGTPAEALEPLKREAMAALREKLEKLDIPGAREADVEVVVGRPFVEIIRFARAQMVNAVVLGAHGRHFVKDLFLGTTADRVVRKGDRPVLVVKKPVKGRYRRLLVPVDFSDASRYALEFAQRVAPSAQLTLLHVSDFDVELALRRTDLGEAQLAQIRRDYMHAAHHQLTQFAREAGVDVEKARLIVREGYSAAVIMKVLGETRADLVGIGTHGAAGLRHVLLGSVAEHVLREARCDVLAVHPVGGEFRLP